MAVNNFATNTGIKDILRISFPMMISSLSSHFMMILDQLILSRYSLDAMTGAASASVWCAAIQCAAMSITMVSGAFAGNYNGACKFKLAGSPTWQMIWFSAALFALSIPLSFFMADICVPRNLASEGIPYFKILMFFSPVTGIYYAISSFFIAINKGSLVTKSILASNVVNIVLDITLVFGCFGIEQYKGAAGAAIGTVAAWITNMLILFACFLRKDIRQKYGTDYFKLRLQKMKECLKLGVAGGIGHIFEMSSWGIIYYLLAKVGKEIAMIQSIAVSVNIFMAFIVSGLEKGIMAMTSNLLGANLKEKISIILKNGIFIHLSCTILASVVFIFFPEIITSNFIHFDVSKEVLDQTLTILKMVLIYFLFDGIVWVIAGVIEGGGDINYTMVSIAMCLWFLGAVPTFILSKLGMLSIELTWTFLIASVVTIVGILYHRYKSDKWIHIKV